MNKYRITNPNNNIVRDCKSRTTETNWNTKKIGFTVGSKTFFGGSAGTSITTKPIKF